MRCLDCNTAKHSKLHLDPRNPVLSEEPCLCDDCFENALTQSIEEQKEEIHNLKDQLKDLKKLRKNF